jgi:acyl carrier protein
MNSPEAIRDFLGSYLRQKFIGQGQDPPTDMSDDHDLLLLGIVDSLDFVNLFSAVAAHFGQEIDFEGLGPEQMTIVGPFCKFVSRQLGKT